MTGKYVAIQLRVLRSAHSEHFPRGRSPENLFTFFFSTASKKTKLIQQTKHRTNKSRVSEFPPRKICKTIHQRNRPTISLGNQHIPYRLAVLKMIFLLQQWDMFPGRTSLQITISHSSGCLSHDLLAFFTFAFFRCWHVALDTMITTATPRHIILREVLMTLILSQSLPNGTSTKRWFVTRNLLFYI